MIEIGKKRRLSRIFAKSNRTLIAPMEWGTAFAPRDWDRCSQVARAVVEGGADAIMTTFGQVRRFAEDLIKIPLVLTISYDLSNLSYPLEYVREASLMGADAVKVHFFGPNKDMPILELQRLSLECKNYGMPFLFEPIPMSDYPNASDKQLLDPIAVKEAVDMRVIIGADIIKTVYTGTKLIQGRNEILPGSRNHSGRFKVVI